MLRSRIIYYHPRYQDWICTYHSTPESVVICIAFTKSDETYEIRGVEECKAYAESQHWYSIMTSSKTNTNVTQCFNLLIEDLLDHVIMKEREEAMFEMEDGINYC